MELNDYQAKAMRTRGIYTPRVFSEREQQLMAGCLGLAGESGEFVDSVKKAFFHNKEIPDEVLSKEIGDLLWYAALICDAKGWKLGDIAAYNIHKLKVRYPQGFSYVDAEKRVDLQ